MENLKKYKINKISVDYVYFDINTNYYNFHLEGKHRVRINIDLKDSDSLEKFFENINELISVSFTNDFKTTGIKNMNEMFSSSKNLVSVDISNLNFENIKDMSYMFKNCENLKEIEISNFKTNKVQNMAGMFENCSIISLDLSNFDTKEVINMSNMFKDCKSLNFLKLDFNTEKVETMENMFSSCTSLTSLNISTFNTTNCNNFSNMFENDGLQLFISYHMCKILYEVIPDNINIFNVRNQPILGEIICTYCIKTTLWNTTLLGKEFELNSELDMYLNNKFIIYSKEYKISSLGNHQIKFILYEDLNMNYMFKDIEDLVYVEMMSDNNCQILSMISTFEKTKYLSQIKITGFSGDTIKSMNKLFYKSNLKILYLIHLIQRI